MRIWFTFPLLMACNDRTGWEKWSECEVADRYRVGWFDEVPIQGGVSAAEVAARVHGGTARVDRPGWPEWRIELGAPLIAVDPVEVHEFTNCATGAGVRVAASATVDDVVASGVFTLALGEVHHHAGFSFLPEDGPLADWMRAETESAVGRPLGKLIEGEIGFSWSDGMAYMDAHFLDEQSTETDGVLEAEGWVPAFRQPFVFDPP